MAVSGAAARSALDAALHACRIGASTRDVADAARRAIEAGEGIALFEGYPADAERPFPDVACVCVNDEVVHGVPGGYQLVRGDLVTVDVGVRVGAWCGDVADSVVVGLNAAAGLGDLAQRLVDATRAATEAAIAQIKPGIWWSEAVGAAVDAAGPFAFVPGYVGHAIGRELHGPLRVLFVTDNGEPIKRGGRHDFRLWPGMCFTVEPILAAEFGASRPPKAVAAADGWTVRLAEGGLAAQVEETVAVTAEGVRVLTARRKEASRSVNA